MSHDDHHDEKVPEYKEIIPFALIVCALFAYASTIVGQNGLAGKASEELAHHSGFEQVDVAFKGKKAVLSGNVANAAQKEEAAELVSGVEGVAGIKSNLIEIGLKPDEPEPVIVVKLTGDAHGKGQDHEKEQAADSEEQDDETAAVVGKGPAEDAHASVEQVAPVASNPYAAILKEQIGQKLHITATIETAVEVPKDRIAEAHQKLMAAKEAVTSTGIAPSRVQTSLEVEVSQEHSSARTVYNYVIE